MYNLPLELIDALKVTPDTLKGLLSNVSEEQARSAKGGDEKLGSCGSDLSFA